MAKPLSKSRRSNPRTFLLAFAVPALLLTACPRPPWPVPVPEAQDVRGDAIRHEVKLPVTIPASCTDENLTVKKLPDRCPPLETLRAFLGMHQGRIASVEGRVFTVDGDLWKLMQALTDKNALSAKPFPENAKILPDEVRRLRTWDAVDSRDATPPQGRTTVAFVYRGFWWTFWRKGRQEAPPPGSPEAEATPSFNTLIVFPEFPERIPIRR